MNENKIAEDIYRINLSVNLSNIKNINIHLIKNINGYTLIDTGWNIEGKTDELLNKLNELQINLDEISMGMFSDYLNAIEFKSTFLRIGSNIFGQRS